MVWAIITFITFIKSIWQAFTGPLSHYPGPKLRAISILPKAWNEFIGNDITVVPHLHAKYGPIVRIAPRELSYSDGSTAFKEIYGFHKSGSSPYKDPAFYATPLNGVDNMITVLDDASHGRQRKVFTHAFAEKSMRDLEPRLKFWAERMVAKLDEQANGRDVVDMVQYFNCTTFGKSNIPHLLNSPILPEADKIGGPKTDIMADLSFNESLDLLENAQLSPWVQAIFAGIKLTTRLQALKRLGSIPSMLIDNLMKSPIIQAQFWNHFNHCIRRVDRRFNLQPERPDLWSAVLDKNNKDNLSKQEHYSNASLFMIAGTETTASALSGIVHNVLINPSTLTTLLHEIRTAFPNSDDVTLQRCSNLPYLSAVISEGLRMYPPIPGTAPRVIPPGGMVIGGKFVPGKTVVGVHHLAAYRNPEHFKDADDFRPERWLRGNNDEKKGTENGEDDSRDHLDAVMPFSTGPRACLGRNLAYHEMRLLLVMTFLHFDLEICERSRREWAGGQKSWLFWEKKPLRVVLRRC
jgi:cytochrome P450